MLAQFAFYADIVYVVWYAAVLSSRMISTEESTRTQVGLMNISFGSNGANIQKTC